MKGNKRGGAGGAALGAAADTALAADARVVAAAAEFTARHCLPGPLVADLGFWSTCVGYCSQTPGGAGRALGGGTPGALAEVMVVIRDEARRARACGARAGRRARAAPPHATPWRARRPPACNAPARSAPARAR